MTKISASEHSLVGKWLLKDGQIHANDVAERIDLLIGHHLRKVDQSADGWTTLFQDPDDNRYWILDYPDSSLHGGGPPRLTEIPLEEARTKFLV